MGEPRNPSKSSRRKNPAAADASAEGMGRASSVGDTAVPPADESGRMNSGDVSAVSETDRAKLQEESGRSTGTERSQVDTLTVPATGPNQAEMAMTGGRGAKGDADRVYAGDGTHGEGKSDAQEAQEAQAAQDETESPVPKQWAKGRAQRIPDPVTEPHFAPEHRPHTVTWPSDADVSPAELSQMIAEAAYYLAERRGFHAGYEIEDWLAAEAEIQARLREIAKAAKVGTPAG